MRLLYWDTPCPHKYFWHKGSPCLCDVHREGGRFQAPVLQCGFPSTAADILRMAGESALKPDGECLDGLYPFIPVRIQMVQNADIDIWSIECFFKASKSFLKLGAEFQSRTYDAMVSHTAIVFTRHAILEWTHRKENDAKTYGELFFLICDDIQDMDLTNALQSLMALFVEQFSALPADITACIKSKVTEWMNSQAAFIQALFENICWESCVIDF